MKNLIQLDFCIYDIFELPVLNEYELYIRNYGHAQSTQVHTQTADEILDSEMQTDDWQISDRWTQCPPHQLIEAQQEYCSLPWFKGKKEKPKTQTNSESQTALAEYNPLTLASFLSKVTIVMDELLEEKEPFIDDAMFDNSNEILNYSKNLTIPEFLAGHSLYYVSLQGSKSLMTCWVSKSDQGIIADANSVILIWKLPDLMPTRFMDLIRILISYAKVSSIITQGSIVIAGTDTGSLQIWDLKEHDKEHRLKNGFRLRWPSCISDANVDKLGHTSPIKNIIVNTSTTAQKGQESLQITSMDLTGLCQTWVFSLNKIVLLGGQAVDLITGSKVKIMNGQTWELPVFYK